MTTHDATEIIREHAAFVWRVLRHCGAPSEQLEDLSQEVFIVVIQRLSSFDARSSLRTWLYGICWNVASAARRRALVRKGETTLPVLPEIAVSAPQDEVVWLKQAHVELVDALARLDEQQRTVFILFELEDLEIDEIAQALGCPAKTCYSRLYAARDKVQALLRRNARGGRTAAGK